jgi:thiamine-phosphate pyrophosphorylase
VKRNLPTQWLITDSKKIEPLQAALKLPKNSGVILRDYDLSENERLELGKKLLKICRDKKMPLLVANSPRLALSLKADGVHFPEHAHEDLKRWRGKKKTWLLTASAHSPRAVRTAYAKGADAVLISPIFTAPSVYSLKKPLGTVRAIHYIYRPLPAYALGGADIAKLKGLKMVGFKGFAGISWVKKPMRIRNS